MSILELYQRLWDRVTFKKDFDTKSLRARLAIWGIPPVLAIILITGYITHRVSQQFIGTALERSVKLQTRAMARDVELTLARYRHDLLYFAHNPENLARFGEMLGRMARIDGDEYRAIGFIAQSGNDHRFWVAEKGEVVQVSSQALAQLRPDPFLLMDRFGELEPGEVWISPINEAQYVFPTPEAPNRKILTHILVLATPLWPSEPSGAGFVLLAVDLSRVRNLLSLYNSPQSPIWSYPRTPEVRYSYLFDLDGWILFQSEDPEKTDAVLSTYQARSGIEGTLGRPGLPEAFRPAARYGYFWKMVREVREGHFGIKRPDEPGDLPRGQKEHYLAYSPVRFYARAEDPPLIYAGLGYVDVSRLTLVAGYKQVDALFLITLASAVLVSLLIYFLGRTVTGPLLRLAQEVQKIQETGQLVPITRPVRGLEVEALQGAINRMIGTLKAQVEEIRVKDQAIAHATMKEVAWEMDPNLAAPVSSDDPLPQMLGSGLLFDRLKREILRAAEAEVDVLVLGETGTGKELTAEAIHRLSRRTGRPFLAINCGALDENLLLDTLFGHTRGAFTEARTDRKGAFLEADGGTLFLDEIQAASPRVQQALLRVLAARRIVPLGSDREFAVDVRIVAASNADLKGLIEAGRFREDLYYRLKVITIETPPLRVHKEDIALMARHFLQEAAQARGIDGLTLSRGALAKLRRHDWPGNVRELKHCMLRAAVMAETSVIQAEDIYLEGDDPYPAGCPPPSPAGPAAPVRRAVQPRAASPAADFNPRQSRVWPAIQEAGEITRARYQHLAGDVPRRTAVYDLSDLVQKGVLRREGRGPATRYVILPRG